MSLSAELFLSCSILQLTFYAISTAYQRKAGFVILNTQVYYIGTLLIVLAALLILNEDLLVLNSFTSNNFIVNDYFSFASKLVICLISILFLIVVNVSFRDEPIQNNFEYVVLITISILGLLLLCSANDLITAYLAIELHSIAFYIMSAFKRNSSYSIESGLKYFIIGALSSALFLFGSALIYGSMGTLSFDDLQMFFSLLFTTENSSASLSTIGSQSVLSSEDLILASYGISSDKSLFSLAAIGSVSSFQVNPVSEYGLLDWCNQNQFENISYFATDAVNSVNSFNWTAFSLVGEDVSLLAQQTVSYFSSQSRVTIFGDFWFETSSSLISNILASYSNAGVIGNVEGAAMLNHGLVAIGFVLICVSLFIKLSIAPFHFWSLDVYEGSPNTTTFFFAVVPKMALFILLMRLCYVSFYQIFVEDFQMYFFILAVLSVFVGSIGGLEQRKLKTLLAYSSISHTGYLLLSFSTGNVEGVQMMFYYLVIYMISGVCFWSVYLFLRQKRSVYFNKSNKELGDLVLLNASNPMLALIMAITLFSMAGIPPIVGFLAKLGIFMVVIKSSAYLVAVFSILFSVISTFYYIRLIKILYFENTLVGKLYMPITTTKALIISLLALSLIILCLDPTIVYLLFYKATLLIS